MKFEDFKSGDFVQRFKYKSFEPSPINQDWSWDDVSINTLLEEATHAIGQLDAFSLIVPDIDLFIRMHVIKEAQSSSRIEGTQTSIDEALLDEEQVEPEKRDDWREVQNYISAINTAIERLSSFPLSNRLLKETHEILMSGVRGDEKLPGQFRKSQNWIGGSSLTDAVFIPPHHDNVFEMMSDLEKFWHNECINVPHLIIAALSHYQFETIHPFCDGNGRIGRLLIPLYLIKSRMISKPSLYLSDFFERNRASYYDALMRVRVSNDIVHWIKFFLRGVIETATKGRDVFSQILELRQRTDVLIDSMGRRGHNARSTINFMYGRPVLTAIVLQRELRISQPTANAILTSLENLKIIQEVTGKQRGKTYVFDAYLKLFLG